MSVIRVHSHRGLAWLLAICVIAIPQVAGQSQTNTGAPPSFDVASAKIAQQAGVMSISASGLARVTPTHVTVERLMEMAFGVEENRILGEPPWLGTDNYDVNAKAEGEQGLTYGQWKPLLQQLLVQRFRLAIHHEM